MRVIQSELIPLAVGLLPLSIGFGAIFFPRLSAEIYGAPTKDRGFVQAAGVRDLFIALVIFELWREHESRLMILSFVALGLVSAGDAFVTWTSGNRKRAPLHLAAAFALIGYSLFQLAGSTL